MSTTNSGLRRTLSLVGILCVAHNVAPFTTPSQSTRKLSGLLLVEPPRMFWTRRTSSSSGSDDDAARSISDEQSQQQVSSSSSRASKSKSLWTTIDEKGLAIKPKAVQASSKAALTQGSMVRKLGYVLKSWLLYSLYVVYRGYRGFFVLLPAVYRQVYNKLDEALDNPFDTALLDRPVQAGKLRFRVTTTILAGVITISYVLSGAVRVLLQFGNRLIKSSSVAQSFEAAIAQQESNETHMHRYGKQQSARYNTINGSNSLPASNDDDDTPASSSPSFGPDKLSP